MIFTRSGIPPEHGSSHFRSRSRGSCMSSQRPTSMAISSASFMISPETRDERGEEMSDTSSPTLKSTLLLQLRLKIREIKPLSIRLNLSVLVDLNDADAVDEEDISGLGLKA